MGLATYGIGSLLSSYCRNFKGVTGIPDVGVGTRPLVVPSASSCPGIGSPDQPFVPRYSARVRAETAEHLGDAMNHFDGRKLLQWTVGASLVAAVPHVVALPSALVTAVQCVAGMGIIIGGAIGVLVGVVKGLTKLASEVTQLIEAVEKLRSRARRFRRPPTNRGTRRAAARSRRAAVSAPGAPPREAEGGRARTRPSRLDLTSALPAPAATARRRSAG
jgi:hypothetical protein